MTAASSHLSAAPAVDLAALKRLADAELSVPSRLRYVALLLGAAMMTIVVASLLVTEPDLPARTRLAFGAMTVIGLAWVAYALWVLTERRVLLARHRIVAGRMAVTCTGAFVAGSIGVALGVGGAAPWIASASGVVMLGIAVLLLRRAHARFAELSAQRVALDQARQAGRAPIA